MNDCEKLKTFLIKKSTKFGKISPDAILILTETINFNDVMNLCLTNKDFNRVLCKDKNSVMWKKIYQNTFGKSYQTPYEQLVEHYKLKKEQDQVLLAFIRKYTHYDSYDFGMQKEIYDDAYDLFDGITWSEQHPKTTQ